MGKSNVLLRTCLLIALFIFFCINPVQGKVTRDQRIKLNGLFAQFNNNTPGVAVAVVKEGQTIFQGGFGMSNLEHDIPIKTDSIFHIASISKQFTTMAIVLLAQQGKLSLDENIRKYIPEVPDFGTPITIRHLAHHTSGLRDQWALLDLAGWRAEDLKTNDDVLDLVSRQQDLNFTPGEEYLYCNTGFTLLAILVDRVSGKSLREFAEEYIFQPLGMFSTHFHNNMSEIVRGRTQAYVPYRRESFRISIPNFNTYGATSLFTTVEDLALWSLNFEHKKIGGEEGISMLLTKGVLNSGKEIDYALGILHGTYKGLKTLGHGGADAGYRSNFLMFPEQDLTIIIFANLSMANPGSLSRQVVDILLEDKLTTPPPEKPKPKSKKKPAKRQQINPEQLKIYTGTYYSPELDVNYTIILEDKKLFLQRRKFRSSVLFTRELDRFVWAGWEIAFQRDEQRDIRGFKLTRGRIRNLKFEKK